MSESASGKADSSTSSTDKKYTDEEWLREKYISERLSSGDVAELCDCSKSTILRYLDKFDIEKRSRSEAAKIRAKRYPHTTEAGAKALKEHGVNSWNFWDDEQKEKFRQELSESRKGKNNPMWDRTGSDHPRWKEDKPSHRFYQLKKWKETRKDALERDNHQCKVCSDSQKLHVHHITPISEGGEKFDLDNLITMCASCHNRWEGLYIRPDNR